MNVKKNVIHIITSLENGGAQEVLQTICCSTSHQYQHFIFYMVGHNSYAQDVDSPCSRAVALNVNGIISLLTALISIRTHMRAGSRMVCLQGWMYHGNFLALLVKSVLPSARLIFSIHNGSDCYETTSWSGYLLSKVCSFFSGMAKICIFVSNKSLTCHSPYRNSIVIPNPIRSLKGCWSQPYKNSGACPEVVFACVARFDPVKNIGFLLDIIQNLLTRGNQIRLLMAGEGMSTSNFVLQEMLRSRKMESNVDLLDVVSDISSVYLRADYTILTSKCESFSNVLLESIACGTPFISSDVGIAEDLLSPESVVIKGYDIAHWVDKVQKALQIRKTEIVSQSVRRHFDAVSETYAPARIAELYADCWAKALGP